jgi:MFS family permease
VSTRAAVGRTLASYAAASVALSLPWPLLLVLAWEQYGDAAHGALVIGAVGAARMLPYVLLSWVVGSLGDRGSRERLLVGTLLLRVGCLAVLVVAVPAGRLGPAVVAAALAKACGTPAYPTVAAAMPRLAGRRSRRATEVLVTVEVAAWVVGPALGGLMLQPWARPLVPVVALGLTVLATGLAWGVPLPGPVTDRRTREAVSGMLRTVRATPAVLAALGAGGLVNVVAAATAVALLPLTQDTWGQPAAGFGVATAWLGFGALAAPLLWWVPGAARSRGRWGLAVIGLAVAWVAVSPVPAAALPVLGLAGALSVAVECAVTETLQTEVPDDHRAGVLGLADAVMVSSAMAGSFLAPLLAEELGPRSALVLTGSVCGAALLPAALLPAALFRAVLRPGPRVTHRHAAARPEAPVVRQPRGAGVAQSDR